MITGIPIQTNLLITLVSKPEIKNFTKHTSNVLTTTFNIVINPGLDIL